MVVVTISDVGDLVLQASADDRATYQHGRNIVHVCAKLGNVDLLKQLISRGLALGSSSQH